MGRVGRGFRLRPRQREGGFLAPHGPGHQRHLEILRRTPPGECSLDDHQQLQIPFGVRGFYRAAPAVELGSVPGEEDPGGDADGPGDGDDLRVGSAVAAGASSAPPSVRSAGLPDRISL